MEMHTVERRSIPRAPSTFMVKDLDGGSWLVAHDLSLSGMQATSTSPRWPGQLIRVRFYVPGEERAIRATVRVVDVHEVPEGVGMGLRFLKLHPDAQLAIHRQVDERPLLVTDDNVSARVGEWVRRMVEDCAQLQALAAA